MVVYTLFSLFSRLMDLSMGLFRGAVFQHGGVHENSPLTLMGRFPALMGRSPVRLNALMGCFPSRKSLGKQLIKKGGFKRFLIGKQMRHARAWRAAKGLAQRKTKGGGKLRGGENIP